MSLADAQTPAAPPAAVPAGSPGAEPAAAPPAHAVHPPSNAPHPVAASHQQVQPASGSGSAGHTLLARAPDPAMTRPLPSVPVVPTSNDSPASSGSALSLRHSRSATAIRPQSHRSPRASNRPLSMAAAGQYSAQLQQLSPIAPFRVGVAEDRNKRWRRTMEDAHTFVYDFGGVQGQGFFGIYDGHAGKTTAEWCGKYLYQYLREHLIRLGNEPVPDVLNNTFQSADMALAEVARETRTSSGCTAVACYLRLEDANGVPLAGPGSGGILPGEEGALGQAFIGGASVPPHVEGFATVAVVRTDPDPQAISPVSEVEAIPEPKHHHQSFLGSLARRTGLNQHRHHHHHHLHSVSLTSLGDSSSPDIHANSGLPHESPERPSVHLFDPITAGIPFRRVLYTANVGDARAVLSRSGRAVRLTYDHKGSDVQEAIRIKDAGGFVMNNRVNGVLAVTRSLGDNSMKEFVVGKPYTTETTLGDEDAFLIIACDGLWDVTSDQEAVDLIQRVHDAQEAARVLLKHALSNFSTDNISIMVIRFNCKPDTGFASRILA